jgi:gamma-glutamylaminecyclotransferase
VHLLFVYGSLKFGLSNHARLRGAHCVDREAMSHGFGLIRYVAGYPALVAAPLRVTRGEVYSVNDRTLAELDEFEECPEVYRRADIPVVLSNGDGVFAFTYLARSGADGEPYPGEVWNPPPDLTPFETRRG